MNEGRRRTGLLAFSRALSSVARSVQVIVVIFLGGLGLFYLARRSWTLGAIFLGATCVQTLLISVRRRRIRLAAASIEAAPHDSKRAVILGTLVSVFTRSAAAGMFVVAVGVAGLAFGAIPAGLGIAVLVISGVVTIVSLYMRSFYRRALRRQ